MEVEVEVVVGIAAPGVRVNWVGLDPEEDVVFDEGQQVDHKERGEVPLLFEIIVD